MKRPAAGAGAAQELLRDYLAFYRANGAEGKLLVCNEAAVKSRARRLLASEPGLAGAPGGVDVAGLAQSCLAAKGETGGVVFRKLLKAFEFLELVCVNLFLSPWRKEIKSLKTFTGNFVYYVQSVLPEGIVEKLLKEIGYVATTTTEFSLAKKLSEEETEQAAFEIFLARIQCEDLLEIAEDVRDSDLVDILQKRRAQNHCSPEDNLDRKHWPCQRNEYMIIGGRSEMLDLQQTHSKQASEEAGNGGQRNELSLELTTEDSPLAASKFTSEQNASQAQGSALANSCIKSSDSEDFLIKYSDIVIAQKPLHFAETHPKASEDKTQNTGFPGSRRGPPANKPWPLTFLSPGASGPQALAILNDVALEGEVPFSYRSQESSQETIESQICDAMSCLAIHGSDSTDQPKELKGNTPQHNNKFTACNNASKEGTCDSSLANLKEDGVESLVYPIEETAGPEFLSSKRGIQELQHSRMKLSDQPGGDREGFNVDLYSSELFCDIAGCNCPTGGSGYERLLVGIPGAGEAAEYLRHMGEPPNSTYIAHPEVGYHGSAPANIQCRGEGCHSSFADSDRCVVPVNETSPEGYVIINKDD
ncbi:uncharacterized protein LOC128419234 [Podarcis raffonei]|uniref:uncharacterized protein LOC128419234 n=1 Tax=Podarcis raffonei TaxID=65483 RepID=UPI0023294FFC|nr:uncharacterized protein LOC128419234 [Podarcis raffonei]